MKRPFYCLASMSLVAGCTLLTLVAHAKSATSPKAFKLAGELLPTAQKLEFNDAGELAFAKSKWTREVEGKDTELFTAVGPVQGRVAVLRGKDGKTESLTAYKLGAAPDKTAAPSEEEASTMFFEKDQLSAYSTCEERTGEPAIGRICVTATPKLCKALKAGKGVAPEVLKEMDTYEMRGLAILLTLRGSDHQLDNVVRTGNRLGLKSALQTTKGQ
ncbi:MAG TPA: hypothetical protein VM432_03700, partial [Bdellovibrionales bacterium]|nr:hypothetical protein [Bdellovibrionales bacterium]